MFNKEYKLDDSFVQFFGWFVVILFTLAMIFGAMIWTPPETEPSKPSKPLTVERAGEFIGEKSVDLGSGIVKGSWKKVKEKFTK